MASTYRGSFVGLGRMVRREWMQAPCLKAAEKIKTAAEALSPQGDPAHDNHSGLYRRSFVLGTGTKNVPYRGRPAIRHVAYVINRAPYSLTVEYGNGSVPEYAPLRRAVDVVKGSHGA